ncbi:MAG TPA: cyclopropane-fatty-acyl-phospholipid synthase family protein [Caulobacteraceae bacterium]|jgi:cyclopropane-fatty-acyl-phospholipid synthase|nr:cyclopropane-fatty-acyl-phospholipid synthase family protein [Caulobacteraceae bacterium]
MIEGIIQDWFKEGSALFQLPGGKEIRVGAPAAPEVTLRIRDRATAFRIARRPSLALGEAYMDGGVEVVQGDIYGFLDLVGRNRALRPTKPPGPFARVKRLFDQWNDRNAARANVHHHYDLSLDLYRKFLDEDLQYSCAYFDHPGVSLEEAQAAKKRHLIAKLRIEEDMSVLDIGCGWGGLGLTMAEHGARVTGVTLSDEQLATAQERAKARGFTERAEFRLQDYRDVTGPFDRIVSVGMFEHVGRPNYQTYFDSVARLLKDDGVAVIHSIGRKDGPNTTQPWIAKYIFPGGYIPALSEVLPHIERAGLWITDVEILRLHYAETLREWRKRFTAQRAEIAALYDERFCRMWEFYLASSEIAFRHCGHMVFQLQLTKRVDAVPITRDYIEAFERGGMRRRQVA